MGCTTAVRSTWRGKGGDTFGRTPLHRAILVGAYYTVALLLDRGADLHAVLGAARGLGSGQWYELQAIDLALWGNGWWGCFDGIARLLVARGATYDLAVAAALGDIEHVRQILDAEPARIRETRPSGRRPLSAAVEGGHDDVARLLLERGADPNWDEPTGPKGRALHYAAASGNVPLVKLLLAHGADPNPYVDSSDHATAFAPNPEEIRELLEAHGGIVPSGVSEDEEVRRAVERSRVGAAAFLGMPDADRLRTLLAHGASPDMMNWQGQTILHHGDVERAAIVLDAGANISARDDEYRSTPLASAARRNTVEMVEFLLARGAPTNLPDDEPWATPLAWADRRGHQ